jgi:segregation and condensation protein B
MNQEQLKNIIEATLMVSDQPLNISRLLALFEKEPDRPERGDIQAALEQLQQDYMDRGIELKEVANGYRFQVQGEYAIWVNHLFDERPPRYSRALMETLAIIAYRQPITRGEIEDIRGVSVSSSIVRTLQEREWIRVVGHRDIPGKPELLATTKSFLDYFNLKKLSELPALAEIKDFDAINPDLFDGLEDEATDTESERQDIDKVESVNPSAQGTHSEQAETDSDEQEQALSTEPIDDDAKVIPFSG